MAGRSLYRTLVPDAPRHRRTEVDEDRPPRLATRAEAVRQVVPGLQSPRLVSSYDGSIDQLLLCFPGWVAAEPALVAGYRSVIAALRVGTRFVVVHSASIGEVVERWFGDAGHPPGNVQLVPLPDHVALTDWGEDPYVALHDAADGVRYLVEPWSFGRAGDALIADAVEEHTDIRASGSPLVFQGGNCLVGDDFWLLGRDYFADTVALLTEGRPPVEIPAGAAPAAFATGLFSSYVDADRRLVLLGTGRPIALRELVGTREGDRYFLDIPREGVGTFQPIFHIDMFVTLVGRPPAASGPALASAGFEVLVGSPSLGDELLGTASPFALAEVYDSLAAELAQQGFVVRRNPLVHRPTLGRTLPLGELRALSTAPDGQALAPAVAELAAAGAEDTTPIRVRDWHHVTWNNCLVESSRTAGRHVYLPTYGHGDHADLAVVDAEMERLWESLGFTVHLLGDFNPFARRQGVVHCLKKYLARGD
jgi:hypothetical protein